MQTDDILGSFRRRRDFVDVLIRRIGRKNRALFAGRVQPREDFFLEFRIFEDCFDHEVGIRNRSVIRHAVYQVAAFGCGCFTELAALDAAGIVSVNDR